MILRSSCIVGFQISLWFCDIGPFQQRADQQRICWTLAIAAPPEGPGILRLCHIAVSRLTLVMLTNRDTCNPAYIITNIMAPYSLCDYGLCYLKRTSIDIGSYLGPSSTRLLWPCFDKPQYQESTAVKFSPTSGSTTTVSTKAGTRFRV